MKLLIAFLFTIFLSQFVHSATYYVSTSGNNSNPGTFAKPWGSIAFAVSKMVAGDTTYVRGGLYKEGFIIFKRSGSASSPIKLLNYPNESPIIESDVIGEKSMQIVNAAGVNKPIGWITIEGFEIRRFRAALLLRSAHDIVIRRNWIHSISAPPGKVTGDVHAQGISGSGLRVKIDRNRIERVGSFEACAVKPIHCNQDHAMYINGSNFVITNNLIYNNLAHGLQLAASYAYDPAKHAGPEYSGGKDWVIANNTFAYQAYRAGIVLWGFVTDIKIENNIFYENSRLESTSTTNGISFYSSKPGKGVVVKNNLSYASGTGGTKFIGDGYNTYQEGVNFTQSGNIVNTLNPKFVNAPATLISSPNFMLTSTSPAINRGLINSLTQIDFDGRTRQGAYDIGAYEYTGSSSASRTPSSVSNLRISN